MIIQSSKVRVRFHNGVPRISYRTYNGGRGCDLEIAQKGCRIYHGTWRNIWAISKSYAYSVTYHDIFYNLFSYLMITSPPLFSFCCSCRGGGRVIILLMFKLVVLRWNRVPDSRKVTIIRIFDWFLFDPTCHNHNSSLLLYYLCTPMYQDSLIYNWPNDNQILLQLNSMDY